VPYCKFLSIIREESGVAMGFHTENENATSSAVEIDDLFAPI
jgi:hypothetical protein